MRGDPFQAKKVMRNIRRMSIYPISDTGGPPSGSIPISHPVAPEDRKKNSPINFISKKAGYLKPAFSCIFLDYKTIFNKLYAST